MKETIGDYPALQMEDDGFLMSLKNDFADSREELFGVTEGTTFAECVHALVEGNRPCADTGSSLPLYIPRYSDEGELVGSEAVPVWSGAHIGFPLYPGLAKGRVEAFLYGNPLCLFGPGREFLACSPAFRLALLVHYALENVIIHELSVESFLLGRYGEMPFFDEHYEQTGLPATSLCSVRASTGLSNRRFRTQDGELGMVIGTAKTGGWKVLVRGSRPKERVLRDCWQELRERSDRSNSPLFTIGGEEYGTAGPGEDGRVKKRSGNARVDYMVGWVDSLKASGRFPMRGSRVDWKSIHRSFENSNPGYIGCWTADTMRRTYNRRKSR